MTPKQEAVLRDYYFAFGEEPPLLMMMDYSHPVYQKLMKSALKKGQPVTCDQIESELTKRGEQVDRDPSDVT